MERLANLTIAFLELLEEESKAINRQFFVLSRAILILLVAGAVLLGGVVILIWGIFLAFNLLLKPVGAAFLSAALVFVLGGGLLCYAQSLLK